MDIKGQLPIEFLLMVGLSVIILIPLTVALSDSVELNQAMSAARTGAMQGAISDSLAIYPTESFQDYTRENQRLLNPSGVKILKITYSNQGFHQGYQKTKIQLKIYASAPQVNNKTDRNCLGDRINFNARKKITESFNTEDLTNTLYNPAFSERYVFTTADVQWQ
ncbi:hypothetical protein [Methanobacterium formicicum]|uniref:Uncharacterized protein n=1 Tax=Methanobacterium formicicum (strain DSM 3637 / PP1) TaxID=1204725 RepID=K2RQA8_METFP|nr:hypothetical protein [Methanobacterium formicicum]EKF84920.1 hypothetical protein A994_11002 [Methanobacterium formicicum DSM 3637]